MLEDLSQCIVESRSRAASIPLDEPFVPTQEIWDEVVTAYRNSSRSDVVLIVNNALVITTPTGNFLTISAQEIPRCWAVLPYVRATKTYEGKVDELAAQLGYSSRSASGVRDEVFKRLPSAGWETEIDASKVANIKKIISSGLGLVPADQERFVRFLSDKTWSGIAKSLERSDWRSAAIQATGQWLAVAAARRGELADALASSPRFEQLMSQAAQQASPPIAKDSRKKTAVMGQNIVIYGAPGTGKSHHVDEIVGDVNVIRTVFHPDTQNSDFFGCLKPRMDGAKVVYCFAPGPFARSVCNAMLDQQHQHFLVIEELNRAPAAAVFGELFQLLDRTDDGSGKYKVDFPNEESAEWFAAAGVDIERLCLPSNLTIYATMNSADQGVYPLDTAFRRRWEQQYLPLEGEAGPLGKIHFASKGGVRTIEWRAFVGALNSHLVSEFSVAEDRLLGLWFLKATELGGGVPAKILLYLWDDLLRHEDRTKAFAKGVRTYGQMNKAIEAGQPIFSDDLLARLEDLADKSVALQSDTSAPADDPDLSPDDDASL